MTHAQLRAELIRSACCDRRPMIDMHILAFLALDKWLQGMDYATSDKQYLDEHYRTLILFCAEALK